MLKLKLQYFSHLMRRVDSLEKTLMLGGIGGRRRRGRQSLSHSGPWMFFGVCFGSSLLCGLSLVVVNGAYSSLWRMGF